MNAPRQFLELIGVSLRLNNRLLFRNIHWTFAQDQNWALIGPNGSGKTLLACSIAGEFPVFKGEIRYGFQTPAGAIPEDYIALVSFEHQKALAGDAPQAVRWFSLEQEHASRVAHFLSQDSVEDVNPFECKTRSPESAILFERLRRRVIALLKIESLMDRTLVSLSNGEMRKLMLARALLRRPRLLILDDAFAGLDSRFRVHLRGILEDLMKRGTFRILLIASQPNPLPRGITHMLCVDQCRVIAQGPRQTVVRHPLVRKLFRSGGSPERRNRSPLFFRRKQRSEQKTLVRMQNVCVRYDERTILCDINWTIRRGESWALVGPNGSGKSTLLSLISGDNPQAYANSIYLFGRRRGSGESVWDLKKRIGWVSSELHLHFPENQTCLETVISGFRESTGCYGSPSLPQRRIAQKMLEYFGLRRFGSSPFGSLSSGLQRLILLARALVKSPALLLLDEPCQGLDAFHRTMLLKTIASLLSHADTTIVYVTHVADELPKGIRRILQLSAGRVYRSGIVPRNRRIIL